MSAEKEEIFKQTELFRNLEGDALRELVAHAVEKRLARDEILFIGGIAEISVKVGISV